METSGLVLDVYDDRQGAVLRSIFPTLEAIPERVKTAHPLSADDRDRLPDDLFALVLVEGDQKLRKYACCDSGNTVLSTEYFLKTASLLPDGARRLAAQNLYEAHLWYGLEPKPELEKLALGLGTAMAAFNAVPVAKGTAAAIKGNLSAVRQLEGRGNVVTPEQMRAFKMAEASGTDLMPLSAPTGSEIKAKAVIKKTAGEDRPGALTGTAVGALAGTAATNQLLMALTRYRGIGNIPPIVLGAALGGYVGGQAGGYLGSKLRKKEAADGSAHARDADGVTLHNGDGVTGEQPARLPQARQVHFVVTKEQTTKPATEKKASTYALRDKFPLDNLLQIKAASAYFDEHGQRFSPEDRRVFCLALVKTAAKLNLPLGDEIRKYGSLSYAPLSEIRMARDLRRNLLEPRSQEMGVLDRLYEKRAEVSPELFCEALGQLDRATGLDAYYDRAISDPYFSTFGMEKQAEPFSEIIGNDMVTEAELRRLARAGVAAIKTSFSDDFLKEFQKDPVGIFKSLPRDQKVMLMRMANETSTGYERSA